MNNRQTMKDKIIKVWVFFWWWIIYHGNRLPWNLWRESEETHKNYLKVISKHE